MRIYCYCYTVLWLHCTRSLKDTMSLLIGRYWVFHWPCVFFFPLALKLQESLAVYEDCSHELKEDKEILTTQQSIVGWGENWEVDTKGFYLLLYSSALRALLLPPLWLYNEYCEICLINKQIWKSKILWRFCFSKFKLNTTKLCFFGQYFEIAKSKALSLQIWFILYLSLITFILNVEPYVTEVKPQAHYMDIKYLCSMVLLYSQGSLYMYNNVLSLPCPPCLYTSSKHVPLLHPGCLFNMSQSQALNKYGIPNNLGDKYQQYSSVWNKFFESDVPICAIYR